MPGNANFKLVVTFAIVNVVAVFLVTVSFIVVEIGVGDWRMMYVEI